MESKFSEIILKYINSRAETKIEQFTKKSEKMRKNVETPEELSELESILTDEKQKLDEQFTPVNWITEAARRANQRDGKNPLTLATHALKFTNPYTIGSSIYAPAGTSHPDNDKNDAFICTASLKNFDIDWVCDAAKLDVAIFLQLSHNNKTLIEYIQEGDTTPFLPFTSDEKQLEEWMSGFRKGIHKECNRISYIFKTNLLSHC